MSPFSLVNHQAIYNIIKKNPETFASQLGLKSPSQVEKIDETCKQILLELGYTIADIQKLEGSSKPNRKVTNVSRRKRSKSAKIAIPSSPLRSFTHSASSLEKTGQKEASIKTDEYSSSSDDDETDTVGDKISKDKSKNTTIASTAETVGMFGFEL